MTGTIHWSLDRITLESTSTSLPGTRVVRVLERVEIETKAGILWRGVKAPDAEYWSAVLNHLGPLVETWNHPIREIWSQLGSKWHPLVELYLVRAASAGILGRNEDERNLFLNRAKTVFDRWEHSPAAEIKDPDCTSDPWPPPALWG